MSKKTLSRRDFLKIGGTAGVGAVIGSTPISFPAIVHQRGELDLSDPSQVGKALTAEGATVQMSSWGFGGLSASVLPNQFAAYTKKLYGVEVKINWTGSGVIESSMTTLPLVNKRIADAGWDVIDKEEDSYAPILALDWTEPINLPQYMPLLTHLADVEAPYLFHEKDMAQDNADIYGLAYQGFEWFQGVLRKDKVDIKNYKDWTDLSRDELKGKGIDYAFNDARGQEVFMGILNSLIKQGIVKGDLWSEDAWTAGITWWKDHMEDKIQVLGDIGNDPTKQLLLQSGDAWWGATWGSYTRGLLGTDWNKKDNVLWAFYPSSGMPSNRETLRACKGAAHPVAARILINWMVSDEFQNVGWTKPSAGGDAVNSWNVTESQYLTCYFGGVTKSNRAASPDWAKPYYPTDPSSLILPVNWVWFFPKKQWISDTYAHIVKGA